MDERQLSFAVSVRNAAGVSSVASTLITYSSSVLPVLSIGSVAAKYNPDQRIVVSASLSCLTSCMYQWTSESLDSSFLSVNLLTPVKKVITGDVTVQLALKPDVLTAGLTYSFHLNANFLTGNPVVASVSLDIVMNSPPTGELYCTQ